MNFAPFSFLNAQRGGYDPNTPNTISDLTFWVDFSDTDFYQLSGSLITGITSSVNNTPTHYLSSFSTVGGSGSYFEMTQSLSNPSLNSAKVNFRPTAYYATNWNVLPPTGNDAIVVGPKTDTTSYPDSTEFYVYNRGTISTAGYLGARFNNTDRGVLYGLSTGTPQKDIISYDFNSPAYLYYGTTNTSNTILTRVNDSATATLYNGSTQTASGSKNDQQNFKHRQFNSIGVYYNGASISSATDTTPVNTQFCEIIIYNRVLSSTERTQVWNYLSNKWNISL